jgi:hypothetical protein
MESLHSPQSAALVRQTKLGASCRVKVPVGQRFSHPPVLSVAFVAEHRDRISHSSQGCKILYQRANKTDKAYTENKNLDTHTLYCIFRVFPFYTKTLSAICAGQHDIGQALFKTTQCITCKTRAFQKININ